LCLFRERPVKLHVAELEGQVLYAPSRVGHQHAADAEKLLCPVDLHDTGHGEALVQVFLLGCRQGSGTINPLFLYLRQQFTGEVRRRCLLLIPDRYRVAWSV